MRRIIGSLAKPQSASTPLVQVEYMGEAIRMKSDHDGQQLVKVMISDTSEFHRVDQVSIKLPGKSRDIQILWQSMFLVRILLIGCCS